LLNLLGNVAAIVVAYYWLMIPDAHGWQVASSAVLAVVVVFLVAWLRAGTLAYFRVAEFRREGDLGQAFRRGLHHLIAVMLCAAVFALLVWLFWTLYVYTPQFGVWLRQKLNGGPSPRVVTQAANWLISLMVFVLIPAIWLPILSTLSAFGVQGARIRRSLGVLRHPHYWLWLCLLVVVGGYIPYRLVWWIPKFETVRAQGWSMGGRFFLAYVMAVSAWIVLMWMVGVYAEREDVG
jgi:hypothetical protein